MNLPLPNLDDHSYDDLVQEAIALIPLEYPEWTDHNPTDTGIILIELFAWLTEMILYQINQIPDQNYASFVSLLKGEQWTLPNKSAEEKQKQLQIEIRKTLLELRNTYRAVTKEDYEKLILEEWKNSQDFTEAESIARVNCLPLRNQNQTNAKGHITLVVVKDDDNITSKETAAYPNLFKFLDQRRLLTTRIHLVAPKYISELYQLLDNLSGVDYIKKLIIHPEEKKSETVLTEIKLDDDQLINFQTATITIEVKIGNESREV